MSRLSNYSACLGLKEGGLDPRTGTSCSLGGDMPRLDSIIYRLSFSRSRLGTSAGLLATGICASFRLENLDSAEP